MQHEYAYHRQYLEWRCVYQTCPTDTVTFLSEDDFRAHMVDHHHSSLTEDSEFLLIAKTCRRVVASRTDANVDCPVCLLSIPNKRSKIGRHLGRHMEDIALPIISLVVPTDEDTDASDNDDDDGETSSDNQNPESVSCFYLDKEETNLSSLPLDDRSAEDIPSERNSPAGSGSGGITVPQSSSNQSSSSNKPTNRVSTADNQSPHTPREAKICDICGKEYNAKWQLK